MCAEILSRKYWGSEGQGRRDLPTGGGALREAVSEGGQGLRGGPRGVLIRTWDFIRGANENQSEIKTKDLVINF